MTYLAVPLVIVLSLQAGCASGQATAPSPKSVSEAFAEAYNARDAAALANLFTEDAELLIPDSQPVKGRAAIAAVFKEKFEQNCTMDLESLSSRADGDQGFDTGRIAITMPGDDGPQRVAGRYLSVMTRAGGDLKIAYQMHTIEPQ